MKAMFPTRYHRQRLVNLVIIIYTNTSYNMIYYFHGAVIAMIKINKIKCYACDYLFNCSSTIIKCHFDFLMFAIITNNNLPPHNMNIYVDYVECRYKMATKHLQIRNIQLFNHNDWIYKNINSNSILNLSNVQYNLNLSGII